VLEDPLEGTKAKLERADEHLQALHTESKRFLKRKPYAFTVDFESEAGWYVVRSQIIEQPPIKLAVLVGEVAYECISALNHAVWQLAARKRGRHKVEEIRREIQFPVALTPGKFREEPVIRKKHISAAAITVLDELQPHDAKHRPPNQHSLFVLKEIADADKHRVLVSRFAEVRLGGLKLDWSNASSDPEIIDAPISGKWLEDGTELTRLRFAGENKPEVRVTGDPAPAILFGTREFSVAIRDLNTATAYMRHAVERLTSLF
jgi:hypothetical protein